MDKQLLADMIEELEQAKRLIERRLRVLYDLEGDARPKQAEARTFLEPTEKSGIRAEIDKRRQAIVAEVDQIRAQAMAQVTALKSGIPAVGGLGGLGGLPGGARGIPSIETLRQQWAVSSKPSRKPGSQGGGQPDSQPDSQGGGQPDSQPDDKPGNKPDGKPGK